jgi:hypothetical protein
MYMYTLHIRLLSPYHMGTTEFTTVTCVLQNCRALSAALRISQGGYLHGSPTPILGELFILLRDILQTGPDLGGAAIMKQPMHLERVELVVTRDDDTKEDWWISYSHANPHWCTVRLCD